MEQISRRSFIRNMGIGAVAVAGAGVLSACSGPETSSVSASADSAADVASEYTAEVLSPTRTFDATTGHNFDVVPDSQTTVGTTVENLKAAITGETGATTKYAAWSKVAEREGYPQLARLFSCTSDAEKIHIALETERVRALDPSFTPPAAPNVTEYASDINLIKGANGEIYETSDMYPSFIKAAEKEGDKDSAAIFTRAKLAESVHAQLYLDAYNTIDTPSDAKYYLCPICGYIHKGENFTACPICLTEKSKFKAY